MKSTFRSQLILSVLFSLIGSASAQDSAVFDASKNVWNLQYQDIETSQWIRKTYIQQNAILPKIQSSIRNSKDVHSYHYSVANQLGAQQQIDTFRIWGIRLLYRIPNLPPVTASARQDPENEDKQQWAQLIAKRNFEKRTTSAPRGWSAAIRVDERAGQTSFVWTPGLKETDPDGIAPGHSQEGFTVFRPELPGLARAKLTGATDEPWGLDHLPDTPFWREKIKEIQDRDYVLVPVLAPVIAIPTPYNAAELARHLHLHVQTWLKYGHIDADVLAHLNRQFDVLVPALDRGNKKAAVLAIEAMIKECRRHHSDLHHQRIELDDARHGAVAVSRSSGMSTLARAQGIDRLAARALIYDLNYIQMKLEK